MAGSGEIAAWAGEQLADAVAGQGIDMAFSYIGIGTSDDDAQFDQINAKLDAIATQLDQVNTHLDEITTDLRSLSNQIDISTKQILAGISAQRLLRLYGSINRRFGSKGDESDSSLFSVLAIPRGAKSRIRDRANALAADQAKIWGEIEGVQDTLTVRAAGSDALLEEWSTLLISQMHGQGGQAGYNSSAGLLQAWFMEAVSEQIKAFSIIKFGIGNNPANQSAARARMLQGMRKQCDLYVTCVERMALSVLRVPPSGRTDTFNHLARWPKGVEESLQRADILSRVLVEAFRARPGVCMAERVSGGYARLLLRPSDLAANTPNKAPKYMGQVESDWPSFGDPGVSQLGPVTEFQGIDWSIGDNEFARLNSGPNSGLRFARYFWPVPSGWVTIRYRGSTVIKVVLPRDPATLRPVLTHSSGPDGVLYSTRNDAYTGFFSIADLEPLAAGDPRIYGQPENGQIVAFVVTWTDTWSATSQGAIYPYPAPPAKTWGEQLLHGFVTIPTQGDGHMSFPEITGDTNPPHLLQNDGGASGILKRLQQGRPDYEPWKPSDPYKFGEFGDFPALYVKMRTRFAWQSDNLWDGGFNTAHGGYEARLFTTSPGESGFIQVYLHGVLRITRIKGAGNIWMNSFLTLVFDTAGTQTSPQEIYNSDSIIDFQSAWTPTARQVEVKLDFIPITAPLRPNTRYSLKVFANIKAATNYDHQFNGKSPRFSTTDSVEDLIQMNIHEVGICRVAGSGYRTT